MPKIVDHEERRNHIADAVTRLVMRSGFESVTMREIAAEAGYAHGAIARYFPNKQSLLTAAFLKLYQEADARIMERVDGLRGLPALKEMCLEILPFDEHGINAAKVVLAFWSYASQDEEIRLIHERHNMRWRSFFRQYLLEAKHDGALKEGVDIDTAVADIAARNAGWQMTAALLPHIATAPVIEASLAAGFESFAASGSNPMGNA